MSIQTDVQAFHEKYNHPVASTPYTSFADPRVASPDVLRLRARLIEEEARETVDALRMLASVLDREADALTLLLTPAATARREEMIRHTFVEVVDGCADLTYVVAGTAVSLGFDLEAHTAEVHRANMSKTVWPKEAHEKYGAGGKGPDFVPPNHRKLLQWD